jgi:hypothetical protein
MNNIYKYELQDNGDIVLKKLHIDETLYTVIKQNDTILLKKKKEIKIKNIDQISNYDFESSYIQKCIINDEEIPKLKYRPILTHVYEIINNPIKIIDNRKLNIKVGDYNNKNGFYYLEKLHISIQGVDSNKALLEILNQCSKNNINIKLTIKLKSSDIVYIEI